MMMAQSMEESLLQAIKKDDTNAFHALTEQAQCGACRLGRFPVLSLFYLYGARRLLAAYENKFLKITAFEALREPAEVSKAFAARAGKCLRLYLNEPVSPLEMLLILDETQRLKRVYPQTKPSAEVKERLQAIYSIRYSLSVAFEGNDIVLDKRPRNSREKKRIATACLCSALAVALAVAVPVTTVSLLPKAGEVTRLGQIDFASEKEYMLKRDIVIPEDYTVEAVNCKIAGAGKKLVFGKGASLGELNGNISDLTIESAGSALFTAVSEHATLQNVTVNVRAAVTTTEAAAFVAMTNYGTIEGVTVNVSGTLNALAPSEEVTAELSFGGIVQNNGVKFDLATNTYLRGEVKNCTVNYSQFSLAGEVSANAAFGGVAGINYGYVRDCTVTGEIVSDTFDLAGVCSINNWLLSDNVNEADLSQTSAAIEWNPIVCGIVVNNVYAVENCENKGSITSVSACGQFEKGENETIASAAGIAYLNRGISPAPYLKDCTNTGNISSSAAYRDAHAAGICVSSSSGIERCTNGGTVTVSAENGCDIYGGGIVSLAYGYVYMSVNEGAVRGTGSGLAYIGGISAHSYAQFLYCISSGSVTATAENVCAGGIFGFSEVIGSGANFYYGMAEQCISECTLNVTASEQAYVGGIAGYVREFWVNSLYAVGYLGCLIDNCYFTGECVSEVSYFGNIVGVCGANMYEAETFITITFLSPTEYYPTETRYFEDNYYVENAYRAFGATATDEGGLVIVEDKGATAKDKEWIERSEGYQAIRGAFAG